jgi:hypothetical protein
MDVLRSPWLSNGVICVQQRQENREVEMAGFNKTDSRTGKNIARGKQRPIEKADARHKRDLFPECFFGASS